MEINLTHKGLVEIIKANVRKRYIESGLDFSNINVTFEVYEPVDRPQEILTHIKVGKNE